MSKKEPRKKLHKGMLLFYIACGIVLLSAFSLMTFRMVLTSKLNAKLDEIRAAGYPATLAELNDYYPAVPDDENAALLYKEALSLYHDPWYGQTEEILKLKEQYATKERKQKSFVDLVIFARRDSKLVPGERLSKASATASQQFININLDCIKIIKKAAKMPKCRFFIDLNKGNSVELANLNPLQNFAGLLATETILAAEADNIKLATSNILTMLNICHALDYEPILMSYIVKLAILSRTISVIEYTMSLVELDDSSLLRIKQGLESHLDKDITPALNQLAVLFDVIKS